MFRAIIVAAGILASVVASANISNVYDLVSATNVAVSSEAEINGLNWAVGDTASYSLDISIIKGSMVYTVKAINGTEAVLSQDVDMGFAGKQACETTLDLSNGQVKKLVCNGQEQQTGDAGNYEVLESKEDNITVPAGTFKCLYIKAQDKKDQKVIEQWANPKLIPVMGMIKAILPSQMGPATLQLTAFKKM